MKAGQGSDAQEKSGLYVGLLYKWCIDECYALWFNGRLAAR